MIGARLGPRCSLEHRSSRSNGWARSWADLERRESPYLSAWAFRRPAIVDTEWIGRAVDILEDREGLVGTDFLPFVVPLAKKYLPGSNRSAVEVGIGDHIETALETPPKPAPGRNNARAPDRRRARSRRTVSQLGEIAVGDEGVAQSLLLLFGEGHEGRGADRARLDSPGDCEVRGERSVVHRVGKTETGARPLSAVMLVAVCALALRRPSSGRQGLCRTQSRHGALFVLPLTPPLVVRRFRADQEYVEDTVQPIVLRVWFGNSGRVPKKLTVGWGRPGSARLRLRKASGCRDQKKSLEWYGLQNQLRRDLTVLSRFRSLESAGAQGSQCSPSIRSA